MGAAGVSPRWQLVAQVLSIRPTSLIRERERKDGLLWFDIRIGRVERRPMLRCSCGGTVEDRPNAMTYDDAWGGCSHIVCLYKGDVTVDKREAVRYGTTGGREGRRLVRLTEIGKKMFHWRWVTRGLQGDRA